MLLSSWDIDREWLNHYGPLTMLINKRKRLIRELAEINGFRWYDLTIKRSIKSIDFEIALHMRGFYLCHPELNGLSIRLGSEA